MNFRFKRIFGIGILVVAIYCGRYVLALPKDDPGELHVYAGSYIVVEGEIADFVEDFGTTVRSYIDVDALIVGRRVFKVKGRAVLFVTSNVTVTYGDRVRIKGMLEVQKRARPDIAGEFKNPQVTQISSGNGNPLVTAIYSLKKNLQQRISDTFPHPVSAFAEGILLGTRSSIPKNISDDFRRAGLTHVLAISGFNIVILIQCLEYLFSSFSRRWGIWLTLLGIVMFAILVGASASVIRASVMGAISVIAKLFGRKSQGLRTLGISGFLMAMADPFIVIWDIGFQLSFAATAGILVFARDWQEKFERVPNFLDARDAFIVTTSAQVFTLPIICYYFQSFSFISFVSNIFVLPFIPWLMLGSFLSLFFGKLIAAPTYLIFKLVLFLIHTFAAVPFGFIEWGTS